MQPTISVVFALFPFVVGALGTTPTQADQNPNCYACPFQDPNGWPVIASATNPPGGPFPGTAGGAITCFYESTTNPSDVSGCDWSTTTGATLTPCTWAAAIPVEWTCSGTLQGQAVITGTDGASLIACINASNEYCLYSATSGQPIQNQHEANCPSLTPSECWQNPF